MAKFTIAGVNKMIQKHLKAQLKCIPNIERFDGMENTEALASWVGIRHHAMAGLCIGALTIDDMSNDDQRSIVEFIWKTTKMRNKVYRALGRTDLIGGSDEE